MQEPLVSVILPVYNRAEYLSKAIDSVLEQSYKKWELIIADDASELETQALLNNYKKIPGVRVYSNSVNLGLFANLNQAINRSSGLYILLLCSDDYLLPNAIKQCLDLLQRNNNAELILSAFRSVDSIGNESESALMTHYDCFLKKESQILEPYDTLPLLLKHGSINGNLTGIFFTRSLLQKVGGFNERSKQVGDWEWVYRVAKQFPILFSKTPIAVVRSHPQQLSSINFKDLTNSLEVIEMVKLLLKDPYIAQNSSATRWALHIMQFHLWFALKFARQGRFLEALKLAKAIDQVTGLGNTFLAMVKWLPERWRIYRQKDFALPPS